MCAVTQLQYHIKTSKQAEKGEVYRDTKPHGAEFQTITGKLQGAKQTSHVFHV